jgi:hypothetical protein
MENFNLVYYGNTSVMRSISVSGVDTVLIFKNLLNNSFIQKQGRICSKHKI